MKCADRAPNFNRLPAPLCDESYRLLRTGVFDDSDIRVYVNEAGDFACLDPTPAVDYASYRPRVQALGLEDYKKRNNVLSARLNKILPLLSDATGFLEIGAADGAFLKRVRDCIPALDCYSVEPDYNTRPSRDALPWLMQFDSLEEATRAGCSVDVVGMFHVFEHLENPAAVLDAIHGVLAPEGILLIEVPCLSDPLLSLYQCEAYQAFYFQRQHPYVYSGASLGRVLEHNAFRVIDVIPFQRYGVENHLQWLTTGRPGGNEDFRALFGSVDGAYREALERRGSTDTVFVTAKMKR
jgi:SAM-dependent methyltransferase